jgi:hypothetical protein
MGLNADVPTRRVAARVLILCVIVGYEELNLGSTFVAAIVLVASPLST